MIPLVIFYIHLVAFSAAFTKRYQDENIGEGLLTLAFMALIFIVGWSIWAFLTKLFIAPAGLGKALDRDALTLLLLTASEAAFYYFYLRK